MTEATKKLDVRGVNCPLPILRTRAILKEMQSGEVLQVIATDPGSVRDIESFCSQTGNTLMSALEIADAYNFLIRKC